MIGEQDNHKEEKAHRYPTKEHCRFCDGKGERYIKKISLVTGKPIGIRPCICTYVDHDYSDDIGMELSKFAKRELLKFSKRESSNSIGEVNHDNRL